MSMPEVPEIDDFFKKDTTIPAKMYEFLLINQVERIQRVVGFGSAKLYADMVDHLVAILIPQADDAFTAEIKNINSIKIRLESSMMKKNSDYTQDAQQHEIKSSYKKFVACMELCGRKGFLGTRSTYGIID